MIVQTIEAEIAPDGSIILKEDITLTDITSVFVTVFSEGDAKNNNKKIEAIRDRRHEQTQKKITKMDDGLHRRNVG